MSVGREDRKAVLRLDEVTLRSLLIVVGERLGEQSGLVEQARQRTPLTVTAEGDGFVGLCERFAVDAHRVTVLAIDHIGVDIPEVRELPEESILHLAVGDEMLGSRVLNQVSFGPRFSGREDSA